MPSENDRHRQEIERLHDGMVVELDRRFSDRGGRADLAAARLRGEPSIDAEVASTISVVRQVASVLGELQETSRQQEEVIYDLRQTIADLQHQKQVAQQELADAVRFGSTERDRAGRAESRLQTSDAQVKRLEDYSVSLKAHLNSLMAVVRENLAANEKAAARVGER